MTRTVIVGAGIAGVSAAGAMRAAGHDGEIVLLGAETELPYRRPPVSKEIVRGDKDADQIRIKPAAWYDDQRIDLRTGVEVVGLDTGAQSVKLADGSTLDYDQLLIATGGSARAPWQAAGIRTLRSLADVPKLRDDLDGADEIVVVGAGLIGSEIAASARALGLRVTLLEADAAPLPHLLPPELGHMYEQIHRDHETELHTGVRVSAITDDGAVTTVQAEDGRTWSAPIVVVAVGMVPHVELARDAGLELDDTVGGIVVDGAGRTSAPGVFAAGDVAALPHPLDGGRHRVEHWQHAQNHGTLVGQAMAGVDAEFTEIPWCWSDQYGINLQVTGWPRSSHRLVVRGSLDDRQFSAWFLDDDGIVRGAVGIGKPADIRTARKQIAARTRLDPVKLGDASADLADSVVP